jgi:hypothetical protein
MKKVELLSGEVGVVIALLMLFLGVPGCTQHNPDSREGSPVARIDIEVMDIRKSPPISVKKETLELPLDQSAGALTFPSENADNPEPFYKIVCHLAAISDVKSPFSAGQWPYEIVRDKKLRYHLLKGGLSIHTWSAAGERNALDGALPVLKADLAHRATNNREALIRMGKQ